MMEKKKDMRHKTERRRKPPAGMSDSWLLAMVDNTETDLEISRMTVETAVAELGRPESHAVVS